MKSDDAEKVRFKRLAKASRGWCKPGAGRIDKALRVASDDEPDVFPRYG